MDISMDSISTESDSSSNTELINYVSKYISINAFTFREDDNPILYEENKRLKVINLLNRYIYLIKFKNKKEQLNIIHNLNFGFKDIFLNDDIIKKYGLYTLLGTFKVLNKWDLVFKIDSYICENFTKFKYSDLISTAIDFSLIKTLNKLFYNVPIKNQEDILELIPTRFVKVIKFFYLPEHKKYQIIMRKINLDNKIKNMLEYVDFKRLSYKKLNRLMGYQGIDLNQEFKKNLYTYKNFFSPSTNKNVFQTKATIKLLSKFQNSSDSVSFITRNKHTKVLYENRVRIYDSHMFFHRKKLPFLNQEKMFIMNDEYFRITQNELQIYFNNQWTLFEILPNPFKGKFTLSFDNLIIINWTIFEPTFLLEFYSFKTNIWKKILLDSAFYPLDVLIYNNLLCLVFINTDNNLEFLLMDINDTSKSVKSIIKSSYIDPESVKIFVYLDILNVCFSKDYEWITETNFYSTKLKTSLMDFMPEIEISEPDWTRNGNFSNKNLKIINHYMIIDNIIASFKNDLYLISEEFNCILQKKPFLTPDLEFFFCPFSGNKRY